MFGVAVDEHRAVDRGWFCRQAPPIRLGENFRHYVVATAPIGSGYAGRTGIAHHPLVGPETGGTPRQLDVEGVFDSPGRVPSAPIGGDGTGIGLRAWLIREPTDRALRL
jgi:hypothetical protein